MKQKYGTLFLSVIICIIGGLIGFYSVKLYQAWKFDRIYQNLFKDHTNVLFLGRPSCGFCNLFEPILKKTSEQYHISYQYINTDSLEKKQLEKLLDQLEIRKSTFSTPRLIITKDHDIIDSYIGYMDDVTLFQFFQKNELIDESEEFHDPYPNIIRLTSDDYFQLLKSDATAYILLGRIGDQNVNEILEYANQEKYPLKFLNPSIFSTKEEQIGFEQSVADIKEDTKFPILLEIQNGSVSDIKGNVKKQIIDQIK